MPCYDTCCRDDPRDVSPAVVLTTVRVSRIARTCGTCRGAIRPGEQYARRFLLPDAEYGTSMTITEHVSAGICYVTMNRDWGAELRMATWSRSEKTRKTVSHTVPAPWPQGATWSEVQAALEAAKGEARRINAGKPLSDDALWVKAEDDRIVIYFEMPGC